MAAKITVEATVEMGVPARGAIRMAVPTVLAAGCLGVVSVGTGIRNDEVQEGGFDGLTGFGCSRLSWPVSADRIPHREQT